MLINSPASRHSSGSSVAWVVIYALACYVFFGFEWLVYILKPSFLSSEGWPVRISVILSVPIPILAGLLILLLVWSAVFGVPAESSNRFHRIIFAFPPALLIASSALLLIDGAVSEVYFHGLSSFKGWTRLIPAGVFVLIVGQCQRGVLAFHLDLKNARPIRIVLAWGLGCAVCGGICSLFLIDVPQSGDDIRLPRIDSGLVHRTPNILLLGSDGISVDKTSLDGYGHKTTPFLETLRDRSLVAENAITNGCKTPNSLPSMISGKSPIDTGVIYSPDNFHFLDSFEHLPGVLRLVGYKTISLTTPYLSDPFHLNLRDGFDEANGYRFGGVEVPFISQRWRERLESHRLFLVLVASRLTERFMHMLLIRYMYNHEEEVVRITGGHDSDVSRLERISEIIRNTKEPWFVHVHLMGTHGHRFFPDTRVFSIGEVQDHDWMNDFYEDAILQFDDRVRNVFGQLRSADRLENTLVIINSDHGFSWSCERTPLLFVFPGGEYAGRIRNNVQHLDIAPTILDYLGILKPEWMTGISILRGEPSPLRPIEVVSEVKSFMAPELKLKTNLGEFSIVVCNKRFALNLGTGEMRILQINGHTAPCEESALPSREQIIKLMRERLTPRYLVEMPGA